MPLILNAHAKINWSLDIVGRRADGYHLLDMLMQAIDLCDELAFEPSDDLSLTVDGAPQPMQESNLIVKAARALNARCGTSFGARIDLHKRIPEQAGLGGGSADCALALTALNDLWELGLSRDELLSIGETLGADVPFCLTGGLARVRGIGERIDPIPGAPRIPLVLVRPGGGLSTAAVFSLFDGGGFPPVALDNAALAAAVVRRDLAAVDALCANALTAPAIRLLPGIASAMAQLRAHGAAAAFMTGSGSTAVGAFEGEAAARRAADAIDGAILAHTCADAGNGEFSA